jgi:cell wall-associated NlpC family hydrolase
VPPLRLALLCLLACLTALALGAAPASADHESWPGEGDAWQEQADAWPDEAPGRDEAQDFWGDEGVDDVAPAPQEPLPPAIPVLPAEPAAPAARPDRPGPVEDAAPPLVTGRTVKGKVARLRRDGKAAIPRGAPKRVRRVIAAANQIVGKPYKWGGGHGSLLDRGYDCSGAVGYALIRGASLMRSVMVSGRMARWGAGGAGRWITVYAHSGHVYLEVAGLRLDTSAYGDPSRRSGVRWRPVVGKRRGFHARHPVGL